MSSHSPFMRNLKYYLWRRKGLLILVLAAVVGASVFYLTSGKLNSSADVSDMMTTLNFPVRFQGGKSSAGSLINVEISIPRARTPLYTQQNIPVNASGIATITIPDGYSMVGQSYTYRVDTDYHLRNAATINVATDPMTIDTGVFLSGDLDNDNYIDQGDVDVFKSEILKTSSIADINGDGVVNAYDFSVINGNWNLGTYN